MWSKPQPHHNPFVIIERTQDIQLRDRSHFYPSLRVYSIFSSERWVPFVSLSQGVFNIQLREMGPISIPLSGCIRYSAQRDGSHFYPSLRVYSIFSSERWVPFLSLSQGVFNIQLREMGPISIPLSGCIQYSA